MGLQGFAPGLNFDPIPLGFLSKRPWHPSSAPSCPWYAVFWHSPPSVPPVCEPPKCNLCSATALGPQVFDLLLYLVQHRERGASKDELLDAVWDGRIVLTSHIYAVRRALGDNGVPSGCMHAAFGSGITRSVYDVERHDV